MKNWIKRSLGLFLALILAIPALSAAVRAAEGSPVIEKPVYIVLNNGLTMMGMTTQAMQLIQGVVFLIFVAVFADRQSLQVIK